MYSPNFKDECLQCFGNPNAFAEYDRICDIYDTLPMIKPSGSIQNRTTVLPVYAGSFNNRDAGCFHPNSTIEFNNKYITIFELENLMHKSKNDVYLQGPNYIVRVEAIIKTRTSNVSKFCKIEQF